MNIREFLPHAKHSMSAGAGGSCEQGGNMCPLRADILEGETEPDYEPHSRLVIPVLGLPRRNVEQREQLQAMETQELLGWASLRKNQKER